MVVREQDLVGVIPDHVIDLLAPYLSNLHRYFSQNGDFSHSDRIHGKRVVQGAKWVAQDLGFNKADTALTLQIAKYHDKGYGLVPKLPHQFHHFYSYAIALAATGEISVAHGTLVHNQDILPDDCFIGERVVRDVDRVFMGGFELAIRLACTLGFRPFGMTSRQMLHRGALDYLFDPRKPCQVSYSTDYRMEHCFPAHLVEYISSTEYETKAQDFCWQHVLPFFHRMGKLHELMEFTDKWRGWYDGEYDYQAKVPLAETPLKIEPVMDVVQSIFELKWANTRILQAMIRDWLDLRDTETERLQTWNNGQPLSGGKPIALARPQTYNSSHRDIDGDFVEVKSYVMFYY